MGKLVLKMYPNLFLLFTSVYAKNDWSADIDRGKPQPEKFKIFVSIMLPHFHLNRELIEYNCINTFIEINLKKTLIFLE